MKPHAAAGLRIGLVGVGRWGASYLRALPATAGAVLVGACDPDPGALNRAREAVPGLTIFGSLRDLLPLVDAVVIAAPSALHAELALACLDARKHVLVEKPLATDVAGAHAVIERARSVERTLHIGHLTLCHPALHQLRALLADGAIGALKRIEVTRTSAGARHRRDSALWSLGPHDIANVLFATRNMEARVREAWSKGHDEAGIQLELSGGAVAHMAWSRSAVTPERRLCLEGARGRLELDETTGSLHLHTHDSHIDLRPSMGPPALLEVQCAQFVRGAADRGAVFPAEALQVVRILAAAQARLDGEQTAQKLSAAV